MWLSQEGLISLTRTVVIRDARQWKAICSDVRFEMVSLLEDGVPRSVGELAEQMGYPSDGLYHHIRTLESAGIVKSAGERGAERGTEATFALAGERIEFDRNLQGDGNGTICRLAAMICRKARLAFDHAWAQGLCRLEEEGGNTGLRLDTAWLTDDQIQEVRHHLQQAVAVFEQARRQRSNQGTLQTLSILFHPKVRPQRSESRD